MSKAHRKSVEKQRQPLRQPNMHITGIRLMGEVLHPSSFRGCCTCGWEGEDRDTRNGAINDSADHLRGMSRQQNAKEEHANRRDVAIRGGYNEGGGYSGGDE